MTTTITEATRASLASIVGRELFASQTALMRAIRDGETPERVAHLTAKRDQLYAAAKEIGAPTAFAEELMRKLDAARAA